LMIERTELPIERTEFPREEEEGRLRLAGPASTDITRPSVRSSDGSFHVGRSVVEGWKGRRVVGDLRLTTGWSGRSE